MSNYLGKQKISQDPVYFIENEIIDLIVNQNPEPASTPTIVPTPVPTSTQTPVPTPTPPITQQIRKEMIKGVPKILGDLLSLTGVCISGLLTIIGIIIGFILTNYFKKNQTDQSNQSPDIEYEINITDFRVNSAVNKIQNENDIGQLRLWLTQEKSNDKPRSIIISELSWRIKFLLPISNKNYQEEEE